MANKKTPLITSKQFADQLVDWVATATQLDPEKDELPNVEDWRRNAEKLFENEVTKKL